VDNTSIDFGSFDFGSAYAHGFARVAACTIPVTIADPAVNAATILEQVRECHDHGVAVAIFPELCLTGYAIDDLLLQDALLDETMRAIQSLVAASQKLRPAFVVGAPLRNGNRLYNCAVVIHRGEILGVPAKSYLPNYREFYEKRHFASAVGAEEATIRVGDQEVPFGEKLVFCADDVPDLSFAVEICEDMWVPVPPAAEAALSGASVIANISGSPITVGRSEDRRLLVRGASMRYQAAYMYAAAGQGESSTDLSWDGQTMVYECGELLGESERFPEGPRRTVVDVDLDRVRQERMRQGTFDDNSRAHDAFATRIEFTLDPPTTDIGLRRTIERFPFVPNDPQRLAQDCYEAYNIQVCGLEQRLRALSSPGGNQPKVVIGVSGGLDSTHALIVAAKAMDRLNRPRADIIAITMPGFATSDATKDSAAQLAKALGVTFEELDIRPAAEQMLAGLGHPYAEGKPVYDVTFENVQAGLRTDYLFRIANHRGGLVLGTGDLSELALGWCTCGVGDQMSHYAVNCGVPKTLIQHLIRWVISSGQFEADPRTGVNAVLAQILAQEISPELVPGQQAQSTEAAIGPYALQDFTLFHVLRHGMRPSRIAFLAQHAWADPAAGLWPVDYPEDKRVGYDLPAIRHWLEVFCQRFFGFSQFKRSAIPNGPKVVAGGSLSPRGDWRMPSDANARIWLADLERVPR
jgi:NAD+ synthase (glutamine-hydrolysing)